MPKDAREIPEYPKITILTADPGFAAFGYGIIRRERKIDHVLEMGVLRTKKADKKHKVLVNEDSFERMRFTGERLWELVQRYGVDIVVFEALSLPRQSSKQVAVKIGQPYALLAMLCAVLDLPQVMMTPQFIKKTICGVQNASKEDVQKEMQRMFGDFPAVLRFKQEYPVSTHNHAWDALGAYVASGQSDVMRALKGRA